MSSAASIPAWWPTRIYYGWALVVALGMTATVSYGILSYGFAVFILPMNAELGWSKTQITGAFSLAHLVAGLTAIPVGRIVDRYGARTLMSAGSMLAALLLLAWSGVRSLPAFYAVWALMGVAMAAVLYEPAFAVITSWFHSRRSRALTVLTFIGGFASVVFVPLAAALVAGLGWRSALVALAVVYALLAIPAHALLLRRRPEDVGLSADGVPPTASAEIVVHARANTLPPHRPSLMSLINGWAFRWTALAFTLSALTTTAIGVHLVPLLLERGHGAAFAAGAMGVLGLMALPGRLILTPLGGWWSRNVVAASIFALQAGGIALLLGTRSAWGVWAFVALFGAGFGAITPARAALMGDLVHPSTYGRVSGVLALLVSFARAAAPVGASVLHALGGGAGSGYQVVLSTLLVSCLVSGAAVLVAAAGTTRPDGVVVPLAGT